MTTETPEIRTMPDGSRYCRLGTWPLPGGSYRNPAHVEFTLHARPGGPWEMAPSMRRPPGRTGWRGLLVDVRNRRAAARRAAYDAAFEAALQRADAVLALHDARTRCS